MYVDKTVVYKMYKTIETDWRFIQQLNYIQILYKKSTYPSVYLFNKKKKPKLQQKHIVTLPPYFKLQKKSKERKKKNQTQATG